MNQFDFPIKLHSAVNETIRKSEQKDIPLKYNCSDCGYPFTGLNVYTEDGVYETQISGICESCWTDLFEGIEDGIEDDES